MSNDVITVYPSVFTLIPDLLNNYTILPVISVSGASHSLFCKLQLLMLSGLSDTLFPRLIFDVVVVESILRVAYESSAQLFNINDAVEDAGGFVWPLWSETRDVRDLFELYDGDVIRLSYLGPSG